MKNLNRALGVLAALGCCCAILAWGAPALADDDERSEPEFRMDLDPVMFVQLDRDELEFDPSATELVNGRTAPKQLTARVSANTDWILSIAGTHDTWDGPWDKPVADILWRPAGSGNYTPLSTASAEVGRGAPAREYAIALDFAIALDISRDEPGTYRYESIVFEVAAQ